MLLSIIVPVYNMAADGKLNFCLDSLVNQTIQDYEIIAVNDASTDNSLEVLREYEAKYPGKVHVVTYEVNKRQGGAKNEGLKVACGEWIGFIDSDDWVTPDYYEKLLKKAEESGADVVGCDYNLVDKHTFEVGRVVENNTAEQTGILDEEKHKSLIMRPGSMVIKIYKHSVIKENQLCFPEGIFYEDNCAAPIWSLYFKHFERVAEPMYYYYQHATSTVHYISEQKCLDRMEAARLMAEDCEKRGFTEQYRTEIEYRFAELHFVITLFSYMQGAKKKRYGFVKQLKAEISEYFPQFQENPYYKQYTGAEEQRLIAMLMGSTVKFYWYYRALNFYRKLKHRG